MMPFAFCFALSKGELRGFNGKSNESFLIIPNPARQWVLIH
ncbi:hypothetical protein BN938_2630 [Mucinivorans hirudinis]|uniref:Uncharacterized protein n=1 Tax=Mucinivorans hirudinis TaxID=1433126 RepID=A0A060RAN3_9BACT|nr:hypothetical protein BN938_2630 [Mucinivorans hirudinis]